jgi:predicted  nucleic acid-binding Zn-ribbon protein
MDERNVYSKSVLACRIVVLLAVAVCVGVSGCGNKMARFEENQLKLQALIEMNAHQIGKATQRAEQNQQDLQAAIKLIRNSTEELTAQIASLGSEHTKLQATVLANSAQMSDKIGGIEQKQQTFETEIDAYQGRIAGEIRNVRAGTAQVAADLAAVADAHARLEENARNERQRADGKVAVLEQDLLKQRQEIEAVGGNVRKLTASVGALDENLLKLQSVLQNDMQNLADVIRVVGQGQIEFEDNVEKRIGELVGSMGLLEQNQAALREQAEEIRSSNQAIISNLAVTLDQLKARISSLVPTQPSKAANTEVAVSEEVKQRN